MKPWQKILIISSPILILLLLTIIGVIIEYRPLISFCGTTLLILCFIVFLFADRISSLSKKIYNYIVGTKSNLNNTSLLGVFLNTLRIVEKILIGIPVFTRGFFLSLNFWIVDLFTSLCEGGFEGFVKTVNQKIIYSLISIGLSMIDYVRGKSIKKPGLPLRILSTVGFFMFFKNFTLLLFAANAQAFLATKSLFSSPMWFMFNKHAANILNAVPALSGGNIIGMLGIFSFISITGVVYGIIWLFSSPKSDSDFKSDAIPLELAWLFYWLWFSTFPAYIIYTLISSWVT